MKSIIPFLALFMIFFDNAFSKSDQKCKVVFRFDDYQLKSIPFYDSLLIVFEKNRIPLCLGIIPFDKNGSFYNDLNQEQLDDFKTRIRNNEIEIALHGYNHKDNDLQKVSFLKNVSMSEFSGLSYSAQYTKLKLAKESIDSLLDIDVNVFIPPFNTYDENTLKALESLKFEIISANIDGSSNSDKISFIPFTLNDLNELQKVIIMHQNDQITIVVMMHSYSFKEISNYTGDNTKRIEFKQLDSLLNWIKGQSYIHATTFFRLSQSEIFDNLRFNLNSLNNNLTTKILNKLEIYRYGVYVTAEYERKHRPILVSVNVFLHLIILLSIYYVTKLIIKKIRPSKAFIIISLGIMIIITLVILNTHRLLILAFFLAIIWVAILFGLNKGNKSFKNLG